MQKAKRQGKVTRSFRSTMDCAFSFECSVKWWTRPTAKPSRKLPKEKNKRLAALQIQFV